ncbi:MAG: hypothetical protein HGA63_00625 [Syntrophobacteraceae bacterium]|nr:hypothetical protein [Syntrophobacteraceae bacterium]
MNFHEVADSVLIQLYRMSGRPAVDYFVGTFLLALFCVVVGELTLSIALKINRSHLRGIEREMTSHHDLSIKALQEGDKEAYKLINKSANDAFGRYFFNMIASSAALLWPIPFALSWMQSRFSEVRFDFAYPLSIVWPSTGYFTTFILCYVLARILFKNARPHLPYFRGVHKELHLPRARQAE